MHTGGFPLSRHTLRPSVGYGLRGPLQPSNVRADQIAMEYLSLPLALVVYLYYSVHRA